MKSLKMLFLSMLMIVSSICVADINNNKGIEKIKAISYVVYLFSSEMSEEEGTIIERIYDTCDLNITLSQLAEVTTFEKNINSDWRFAEIQLFFYFMVSCISDMSIDEYNVLWRMFHRYISYRSDLTVSELITVISSEINGKLFTELEKEHCGKHFVGLMKDNVYIFNLAAIRLKEFGVLDLSLKAIYANEELSKKYDEICREIWNRV